MMNGHVLSACGALKRCCVLKCSVLLYWKASVYIYFLHIFQLILLRSYHQKVHTLLQFKVAAAGSWYLTPLHVLYCKITPSYQDAAMYQFYLKYLHIMNT